MKLKEVIGNVDYDDLVKIKTDISAGGKHINKLIDKKIEELEKDSKVCAVCGRPIMFGDDSYTLTFGKDDFKKKANFCAIDCLEFFMNYLKKKNEKQLKKE